MRCLLVAGSGTLILSLIWGSPEAGDQQPVDIGAHTPGVTVAMNDWEPYYQPFVAVVSPQTPVRWVNSTPSPHSVRHDGCKTEGPCLFNSGAVAPDEQFVLPGLPPGRYPYHCELHPIMRGMLVVK